MKYITSFNAVIAIAGLFLCSFTGDTATAVAFLGWYLIGRDYKDPK